MLLVSSQPPCSGRIYLRFRRLSAEHGVPIQTSDAWDFLQRSAQSKRYLLFRLKRNPSQSSTATAIPGDPPTPQSVMMNRQCMTQGMKARSSGAGRRPVQKPYVPGQKDKDKDKDTDGKEKKGPRPSKGSPSKGSPSRGSPSSASRKLGTPTPRDSASSLPGRLSARASALKDKARRHSFSGGTKQAVTIPIDDENEDPTKGKCLISPTASFSAWTPEQTQHMAVCSSHGHPVCPCGAQR